ncbi:MAG: adenylate/guanylate cyclase domain-containing protein [Fimbriimonadales bacterium]
MNRRKARRIAGLVAVWVIAMAVILWLLPGEFRRSYALGYALACALAIYAISKVHQYVLPQLRRMPLYVAVGVTALLYMGTIVVSSALGIVILVGFATGSRADVEQVFVHFFSRGWEVTLGVPFLIALGILFLVELSRRIGPGRLVSLLLGRYRNPREETRLFLLIDVCGSTTLAESLGSVLYSTLLRDFFDDLTEPVLETGGEIVEYVGDEAIVSWRFRPERAGEALRCYLLFRKRIQDRSSEYKKQFGVLPKFKAALHAGPVVATEVGQLKTQVVLHGDALNTASRVLAQCNELEAELLVTESVAPYLAPVEGFRIVDLGRVSLRGKWEAVGLSRLTIRSESATD